MKETHTFELPDEQPGIYHIPGVHNSQQTICGWVDAPGGIRHLAADVPCNCGACIAALRQIKALRFPQGYFDCMLFHKPKRGKTTVINAPK